jgi:hypothetical protein
MGAGASAAFPDQLNEEQLRIISATDFKNSLFLSLQSPDGTVPKDMFVNCFEDGPEREVRGDATCVPSINCRIIISYFVLTPLKNRSLNHQYILLYYCATYYRYSDCT